ncbi:hypothetical protein J4219_07995 [Candidatus Woesearchaeota archaeon]|nr:hypothetical protein [Candidatus Woesearchaeota archaeon]
MPVTHPYDKPKQLELATASVCAVILAAGFAASYINSKLKQMSRPHIYQENVVAGPEQESYCVVDGKRAYLSIDGATIEDRVKEQKGD